MPRPASVFHQPESSAVIVSSSTLEVPPPVTGPIGIPAIWIAEAPKIRESSGLARDLCEAHERTVEPRSDLTECQKNARRRIVLEAWYAEQARAAEGEAQ